LCIIQLSIALVTAAGVSFRAVRKIFIYLDICLQLNLKVPTHTTVLNWTKKQGISQFQDREFYLREKWVLIADESIQFGNKKLLLVLAVPERRCNEVGALSYHDLTPLVLKVGASWKSEDIVAEIRKHIDLEQVSYCISDTGSNLTKAFKLMNCKHISDINHRFSLIIQAVFEDNQQLNDYTKALKLLRAQKSMSKIARIVPPNQRIMNRFMNLTPLFEWGMKMIQLLYKNQLTEEEKAALSFIEPLKEFIFETYQILIRLGKIQEIFKNKGFSKNYMHKVKRLFSGMNSANALKIKEQINNYFKELTSKQKGKRFVAPPISWNPVLEDTKKLLEETNRLE